MGKYTRKTDRKSVFTQEVLDDVRARLANGESKRQIARSLGVLESTLRNRLKKGNVPASLGRFAPVFTPAMEVELANLCRDLDARFYGVTRKRLMQIVYQFAEVNGLSDRFNNQTKMAGKDFVKSFCKRHKLSFRKPEHCSLGRAIGFNRIQVNRFFENLRTLCEKKNFRPHQIFNMDETGISTVPNKTPKVISPVGKKGVCKIASGERGQTVSVAACCSASGHYVPPAIIFARKRMKLELYSDAPMGSLPLISDSGYMNTDIFIEWLKHFANHTKPSEDNPVLLILDNHSTHLSLASINYCRENHITMLSLPPHASHKIQPLDKGFFGPLKTAFSIEVEKWLVNNPGQCVTQSKVCGLFTAAYNRVASVEKAVNAFKATGIYPYNPDVFTDEDFAPSAVTERNISVDQQESEIEDSADLEEACQQLTSPIPSSEITLVQREVITFNDGQQQGPSNRPTSAETVEQVRTILGSTRTCAGSVGSSLPLEKATETPVSNQHDIPDSPSQRDAGLVLQKEKITSEYANQLKTLLPLPKCKIEKKKTKSQKSEIVSGSPFKKMLEEKIAKKENDEKEKEAKRKARQDKKNQVKDPTCKRPAKLPKMSRLDLEKEDKETFCAGCGESFEDAWVQCNQCQQWWHEDCSDYVGTGSYICDHC